MTSTLVVSVEPPWPSVHGGRLRTARLAEALRDAGHRVTVAAPGLGEVWSAPPGIATVELSTRPAGSPAIVRGALSLRPKVGVVHLGRCTDAIAALATEAEVVVWAQPYVAAVAGPAPGCVEVIDVHPVVTSPSAAVVGLVASYTYGPNVDAARWFVGHVWPAVRAVRPDAVLVVAGRGADRAVGELAGEGIEVIADFDDARALYARTAVVVAPVRTGGGSQLKVTEALSHHRVVVASPYSAEAAPATARDAGAVVVADTVGQWVDALVRLLVEVDDRRRIEAALGEPGVMPTWDRTLRDAVEAIDAAVAGHDHRRAGGPVRRRRRLR